MLKIQSIYQSMIVLWAMMEYEFVNGLIYIYKSSKSASLKSTLFRTIHWYNDKNIQPRMNWHIYKLFILCELTFTRHSHTLVISRHVRKSIGIYSEVRIGRKFLL